MQVIQCFKISLGLCLFVTGPASFTYSFSYFTLRFVSRVDEARLYFWSVQFIM